jgi:hypothetical protein
VARGSGSPDFANFGAPVAKSSGAWVWDKLRDMRNPPRALAGLGEARGHGCDGGGGSARRARRRARERAVLGTGKGANGAEHVRGAKGATACVVWP